MIAPPDQCIDPSVATTFALDGSGSTPGSGATIADPGGYGWATTLGSLGGGTGSTETLTLAAGVFGVADVTLDVTDTNACTDNVTVTATAFGRPTATLVATPSDRCTDPLSVITIQLDASGSTFPDAPSSSFVWTVPAGHSIVGVGSIVDWIVPGSAIYFFPRVIAAWLARRSEQ